MKKYYFILLVAAMFAASCSKQLNESRKAEEVTYKALSLSTGTCKTALGSKESGQYSVVWKAGDKIMVNGVESLALTADVPEGQPAEFYISSDVQAPYNVVYPSSAVNEKGMVAIAAEQKYVPGNFDSSCAIATGSSADENISLNISCAFVKVSIARSAAEVLKEVKLYSYNGEAMSGDFSVDYASGIMTLEGNARNYVAVSASNSLVYDGDGKASVVLSVPAGTYARGFFVSVTTTDDKHMFKAFSTKNGCTLDASTILTMPEFTFSAEAGPFSGGEGTSAKPYLIATTDDLVRLSALSHSEASTYKGKYFKQVADIDMSEVAKFSPLFSSTTPFTGTYDGNSRVIENLTVSITAQYAGLFAYQKASASVIKNVVLRDADISSTVERVGGICGMSEQGTIDNCSLESCTVSGKSGVGGIVGRPYTITVKNCKVDENCVVSGTESIGGICGGGTTFGAGNNVLKVISCTSAASVTASGNFAGGIIGGGCKMKTVSRIEITDCKAYGQIKADIHAAGIIGHINADGEGNYSTSRTLTVDGCASYCNVIAKYSIGGIMGNLYGSKATGNIMISNCGFLEGSLTSTGAGGNICMGGILGYNQVGDGAARIINCFTKNIKLYETTWSGASYGGAGILGKSTVNTSTSQGPIEIKGCYSSLAKNDYYRDGNAGITPSRDYGGMYEAMSSTSSAGVFTIESSWYSPDMPKSGPDTYPLKKDASAQYTSLETLLSDLNAFASSYKDNNVQCREWIPGSDGYPILSGMNSEEIENGTLENPVVNPEVTL